MNAISHLTRTLKTSIENRPVNPTSLVQWENRVRTTVGQLQDAVVRFGDSLGNTADSYTRAATRAKKFLGNSLIVKKVNLGLPL